MKRKALPPVGKSSIGFLLAAAISSSAAVAEPLFVGTGSQDRPMILAADTTVPKMKLTYRKLHDRNVARRQREDMAALETREQSGSKDEGSEKVQRTHEPTADQ
jgi:hypothetical protein